MKWVLVAFAIVSTGVLFYFWPTEIESATVIINGREFIVRVADEPAEQQRGMSGKTDGGMLFVFSEPKVQHFWMHQMLIPLDVLWIQDGEVVDLDRNVPAPGPGEAPATMNSSPHEVQYVLELPAGEAEGILPGSAVEIVLDESGRPW